MIRPPSPPRRPMPPADRFFCTLLCCLLAGLGSPSARAGEAPAEALQAADQALRNGDPTAAVRLATALLADHPKDSRLFFLRGQAREAAREFLPAVADYTAGLQISPKVAFGYQSRGGVYFRLGRFAESIADFDTFIALSPGQAPHHWQRGISLYYAGRFEDGRKQFELHQTVNSQDVENAVWHFLCVARASGLEKARASLIPIQRDTRVPMMQVHALFAGKALPADVLKAAEAGAAPPGDAGNRRLYAHLYLGLYHEAIGETKLAREHILKAAETTADHYMADVARVHAAVLQAKGKQ